MEAASAAALSTIARRPPTRLSGSPAPLPRMLEMPTTPRSTGPAALWPDPDDAKSAAKVQYTDAPTPTRSAPTSSGPERGQTNQDQDSGGKASAPPGPAARWSRSGRRARAARSVESPAITAKATHAPRQAVPATSAIGTAMATPHPVPELIIASARPRRFGGNDPATAVENGGGARAALTPATITPAASSHGE